MPPDLAVAKSDSSDPVAVGDHLTYTLTVNNAGEGDATGVTLTDTLPTEVEFVSVTSSDPSDSCAEMGGVVECDLGDLASMASATVTIVVRPTATGTITNTVEVTTAEPDTTPNTDSEQTTVSELLCNGLVPPLSPRGTIATCAAPTATMSSTASAAMTPSAVSTATMSSAAARATTPSRATTASTGSSARTASTP